MSLKLSTKPQNTSKPKSNGQNKMLQNKIKIEAMKLKQQADQRQNFSASQDPRDMREKIMLEQEQRMASHQAQVLQQKKDQALRAQELKA